MSKNNVSRPVKASPRLCKSSPDIPANTDGIFPAVGAENSHPFFQRLCYCVNVLLILSTLLVACSVVWECSTRKYLKGFSDAIIPASSSAEEKIEAIVQWMSHDSTRSRAALLTASPDRNPSDTLNSEALLQVCGSATNAFVNLADSAGLASRRLLLLDSHRMTKHVVAEVLVDGRWIIVDPVFHVIPRASDGRMLTRQQLADPATFSYATRGIPRYDPHYTYNRTVHVHLARIPVVGVTLRRVLDHYLPGWDASVFMSLLLERESLATLVFSIPLTVCLFLCRVGLRTYGQRRLGLRYVHVRKRFRQAYRAFFDMVL